ncbi:MAG TPA: anthranilate synthase component I family protein [Nitrospiraceae bacterium]|nr:anthranilate synthase component I family protein [Nitrospiraceae bacterium]
MIYPSRLQFLTQAIPPPLALALPCPNATPYDLYRRIAIPGRSSFLLESGKGPGATARYSFFGSDPYLTLRGKSAEYELRTREGGVVHRQHPFQGLAEQMRASRLPKPQGLPPFWGGAVGFFSYDLVRQFEPLPSLAADDLGLPDVHFIFVDLLTAIDHSSDTLHVIFSPPLERLLGESREKLYREGCDRLAELEARLSVPMLPQEDTIPMEQIRVTPNQSPERYMEQVERCQQYIRAGDIYQANLSHRFTVESLGAGDLANAGADLYRRLRAINPSPFSALFMFDDLCLVSSSPERLVRLEGTRIETRPIAGTRPRGRTHTEDRQLADELLANAKERAEHIMLVDLERNDLGRVCRYGSIQADEFMIIERYSHVNHIVSNITGTLRDGLDAFDIIPALFPGGTITGVPKIRCMEIIESLEPVRRGAYTGSLGYLSWSGDLDLNIIIRTLLLTADRGYVQVGAGIVADSDPSREYQETLFKAQGLLNALKAS